MTAAGAGLICEKCGERPAVQASPPLCAQCKRAREAGKRYASSHRAREQARKAGPPDRLELDADGVISLVAALRVLDAARDRLRAIDIHVQRDAGAHPALARHLGDAALGLADAYDQALGLLRLVIPGGALPPGSERREPISDAARHLLGRQSPPQ